MAFPRKWYTYLSRERIPDDEHDGINPAWWLKHRSRGRENSDYSPYLIANEWICSSIGRFLRLPIPPFALMRSSRSGKGLFAYLDYGTRAALPDDVKPAPCVTFLPEISTLIICFDILIGNEDRHPKNLKVDDPDKPSSIEVFDHDWALFGHVKGQGITRLQSIGNNLGIKNHVLLSHLRTRSEIAKATAKIATIPPSFIEDVCREAEDLPIDREESEFACEFLIHRKDDIEELISANRSHFSSIHQW